MTDLPISTRAQKRATRGGYWLFVALTLAVFGLAATAIAASSLLLASRGHEAQPVEAASAAPPAAKTASAQSLPGFQRRGSTYLGEFTTRDGQQIRLVIDARTQSVIGAKVIGVAEQK